MNNANVWIYCGTCYATYHDIYRWVVVGVGVRTACIIEKLTDNGWTVEPPDVCIKNDEVDE